MEIYQWKSSLLESELTPNAKLVGIVISEFYRDGTDCYPSLSTILRFTSFGSINTVQNAIKELKENKFIEVSSKKRNHLGGRPCNLYIFCGVREQLSSHDSSHDSSDDSSDERSHDSSPRDKETTKTTKVTKTTKKKKINKKEYGVFKNVLLTDGEYQELFNLYYDKLDEAIEKLSVWKDNNKKKNTHNYGVFLKSQWLYKAVMEQSGGQKSTPLSRTEKNIEILKNCDLS